MVISKAVSPESDHRVVSGFWRRVLALILDGLLLGAAGLVCGIFLFDYFANLGGWGRLVGFSVALVYFGVLNSAAGKGQTPGKRAMRIEVVDRSGRHISLPRSLLRYSILAVPFFLNGVLIPPDVMMSPAGFIIGIIVAGFGGAVIYLYIFNRRTRQSLHDLAVGTFVTKTVPRGGVTGSIWRPHLAVTGIWIVGVIGLSIGTAGLRRKEFQMLIDVQQAVQASGKVHVADVKAGKIRSWGADGSRSETTCLHVIAYWKRRPKSEETPARSIASIVLDNYPEIADKDVLAVTVHYGYDIGIARAWRHETYSFSPGEWQRRLTAD